MKQQFPRKMIINFRFKAKGNSDMTVKRTQAQIEFNCLLFYPRLCTDHDKRLLLINCFGKPIVENIVKIMEKSWGPKNNFLGSI